MTFGSPRTGFRALQQTSEYRELFNLMNKCRPEVVRQVVRDCWNKSVLGSEYHLAFLVSLAAAARQGEAAKGPSGHPNADGTDGKANATIHQASTPTLERTIQDFGKNMVRAGKRHIIGHLTTQDLDDVSDAILAKASDNFLDKCLARRLETIDARPLVNALARAQRLGYEAQDIVEGTAGAEHVLPTMPAAAPAAAPLMPTVASQPLVSRPGPDASILPLPLPSQRRQQQQPPGEQSVMSIDSTRASTVSPPTAGATDDGGPRCCPRCDRLCSGERAVDHVSKAVPVS